jgi:pantetheine-phosphate adenylyltransferase
MSERIALCPGSFDPITVGHEDIIRRALALSDRVIVAVGYSPQQSKQGMFGVDERVALIREVFADEPRIEADSFQGLLVDYARKRGARLVVKGLRTVADFEYEMQMALMNRAQHPGLETVFMAPEPAFSFVSSTLIRQIAALGGDVRPFVSPPVFARVVEKIGPQVPVRTGVPVIPVGSLIEEVAHRVENTSLRGVAREIGMSPTGLKKLLEGTEPPRSTLRKLEAWWVNQTTRLGHAESTDRVLEEGRRALNDRSGTGRESNLPRA